VTLLAELRGKARPVETDGEAAFDAEQNALVMADAERYYRTMVRGGRPRGISATRTWRTPWTAS
jgi:hypothetical protein